ncbi:RidA family protein [Nocardioides sp. cx-173]|uniref:RidA family protein n=1 Tax=Nocardioides sp. cx-173 TaxID=2898796 RepID=UPI001E57CE70|nr:RidA family protein [Nocardioides sp. cx-173]MCD4526628.1 RidA family protein [Nocardioides sp. cx-173]UGB40721.1 RidA family protein [Nocardioides sp. cx-173]
MRRSVEVPGLGHGGQPIPMASVVNGIVMTGGISGKDPATGTIPEDPAAEVAQAFANLRAVLDAAGASPDEVAKVTVFVADRDIRGHVNPHWLELFPDPESRPARHTLEANLTGMRLQLECLAVLGS